MRFQKRRRNQIVFWVALLMLMSACNFSAATTEIQPSPTPTDIIATTSVPPSTTPLPPTETPIPPTPTVVHLTMPGEPPSRYLYMTDSITASEDQVRGAKGGDDYAVNRFERPFLAEGMTYRPDLDIVEADIAFDDDWLYFTIWVQGLHPESGDLPADFGVEFDLDVDGDGDWLVMASSPSMVEWTTIGVRIWEDGNDDVGGATPVAPDAPPAEGDGYEHTIFDQGQGQDPDAAWARQDPEDATAVQIAVKREFLDDEAFLWGVWADEGLQQPGWLDYNDYFSLEQAGSPMEGSEHYPLKELAGVDNSCRMYYGFTPAGNEPGLCTVQGTIQNCTPHRMLAYPGGIHFDGQETAGGTSIRKAPPGTYSFYDQDDLDNNDEHPLVLTATLRPGGLIQIRVTGLGDTYACK